MEAFRNFQEIAETTTRDLWNWVVGVSDSEVVGSGPLSGDKSCKHGISDTRAAVGKLEPFC
ncbi:hypothetical protein TMatcc_000084 [Talaromyces marneffei ATCC 18224]